MSVVDSQQAPKRKRDTSTFHFNAQCDGEPETVGGRLVSACFANGRWAVRIAEADAVRDYGEEACARLPPSAVLWCQQRPGRTLDLETAMRWGLVPSPIVWETRTEDETMSEKEEDEDSMVTHVKLEEYVAPDGSTICCYSGANVEGADRLARWAPILFHTLSANQDSIQGAGPDTPGGQGRDSNADGSRLPQALDSIDDWCVAFKGRALRISVPGSRPARDGGAHLYCRTPGIPRTLFTAAAGFPMSHGMQAAVLNAIALVRGEADSLEAFRRDILASGWRDLADGSKWVRARFQCVSLERLLDESGKARERDVDDLLRATSGVFIVELIGTKGVRHMVVTDTKRKALYDMMEIAPLELSRKSLEWCCGEGSALKGLGEVRRVRDLQPGKLMKKSGSIQPSENAHNKKSGNLQVSANAQGKKKKAKAN